MKRYAPIFNGFKLNNNILLVSLPLSGRGAFLKGVVENKDQSLLRQMTDLEEFELLFSSGYDGSDQFGYLNSLITPFLKRMPRSEKNSLLIAITAKETDLALQIIEDYIKNSGKTYILFIMGLDKNISDNPDLLGVIERFYLHGWFSNKKIILICPIINPSLLFNDAFKNLQKSIFQDVQYLPSLDKEELDYVRKRFELTEGITISDDLHIFAQNLCSGHYSIYKYIVKSLHNKPSWIGRSVDDFLKEFPEVRNISGVVSKELKLIELLPKEDRTYIYEQLCLSVGEQSILKSKYIAEPDIDMHLIDMTPLERVIFDALVENMHQAITKEEIAKIVWGEKWVDNYSEWALDKQISRLRKKLSDYGYDLEVIRNRGVVLYLRGERKYGKSF